MSRVRAWWRRPARPWEFWLPQSGLSGGVIGGVLAAALVCGFLAALRLWGA